MIAAVVVVVDLLERVAQLLLANAERIGQAGAGPLAAVGPLRANLAQRRAQLRTAHAELPRERAEHRAERPPAPALEARAGWASGATRPPVVAAGGGPPMKRSPGGPPPRVRLSLSPAAATALPSSCWLPIA